MLDPFCRAGARCCRRRGASIAPCARSPARNQLSPAILAGNVHTNDQLFQWDSLLDGDRCAQRTDACTSLAHRLWKSFASSDPRTHGLRLAAQQCAHGVATVSLRAAVVVGATVRVSCVPRRCQRPLTRNRGAVTGPARSDCAVHSGYRAALFTGGPPLHAEPNGVAAGASAAVWDSVGGSDVTRWRDLTGLAPYCAAHSARTAERFDLAVARCHIEPGSAAGEHNDCWPAVAGLGNREEAASFRPYDVRRRRGDEMTCRLVGERVATKRLLLSAVESVQAPSASPRGLAVAASRRLATWPDPSGRAAARWHGLRATGLALTTSSRPRSARGVVVAAFALRRRTPPRLGAPAPASQYTGGARARRAKP